MLDRKLGLIGAIFLGLGAIVGTGVFVSIGFAVELTGTATPYAILFATLLAVCNGLSSAQLAAAHPVSGGTYEYGYRYLSPFAGVSAGFLFLTAKSASAATAALGTAIYIGGLFQLNSSFISGIFAIILLGVVVLVVARDLKKSNFVNGLIVTLVFTGLIGFAIQSLGFDITKCIECQPTSPKPTPKLQDFCEAVALLFVAYTGYGRIATMGEEVTSPRSTIPKAIVTTLSLSAALYILVSLALSKFAGLIGSLPNEPFIEVVASKTGGPGLAYMVAAVAAVAMVSVLINLVLGLSRVALAMGRRRDLDPRLANLSVSNQPTNAILFVGVVIAVITMFGGIKLTWSISAFTVLIYYGITNLCALRLPTEDRLFPRFFSYLGLFGCFGLALFVDGSAMLAGGSIIAMGFTIRSYYHRP